MNWYKIIKINNAFRDQNGAFVLFAWNVDPVCRQGEFDLAAFLSDMPNRGDAMAGSDCGSLSSSS